MLNIDGINDFVGNDKINYKPEQLVNIYYKWNVIRSA